jgi:5-formyltetrahydrofolate cyclo-ligase
LRIEKPMIGMPDKVEARAAAKSRRAAILLTDRVTFSQRIAKIDLGQQLSPPPLVVSGYVPLGDEIDPQPLMSGLQAKGYQLSLPVLQGRGLPLLFRRYAPGDSLERVQWGIQEPRSGQPLLDPDILLVPLLAFDAGGHRLGYGGGYYDRTIAALRLLKPVLTVGIAFDQQRIDAVPHLDYDQRLDFVLTPSGLIRCQR